MSTRYNVYTSDLDDLDKSADDSCHDNAIALIYSILT